MKRIIWELADGRKKYSTNSKGIELWSDNEVSIIAIGIKQNGSYAFTKDLAVFGALKDLKKLGFKEIIEIINYSLEDSESPLTEGIII